MNHIIAPVMPSFEALSSAIVTGSSSTPLNGFEQVLQQVEQQENTLGNLLNGLASGQVDNLHQVMLGMEEAKMQFELLLQVRNRALEAYQELMRMQI
ncbi:flagellar hook-basal body complex protein FliE [Neisseriaceae bacterium TC5R-5]|nr:flagellar hook-basal body complex protein FliE [Neisseriaceae bacterium TC5R-5]